MSGRQTYLIRFIYFYINKYLIQRRKFIKGGKCMLKWFSKKRNKKGFTLVELVVVIAILGILAAIAVPKLSKSRENAAISAHNANVRTLESAATLAVSEGSGDITWDNGDKKDDEGTGKGWGNYLQAWPQVPTGVAGRKYDVVTNPDTTPPTTDEVTIEETYKVVIEDSGKITVTPGKISDEKFK